MKHADQESLKSFENSIAVLWESGELPYLIHLCGGNEQWLVDFFSENVKEGDWIFSTHRNHFHALLAGISPDKVKAAIQSGDSMFMFDRERKFFSSAVLSGQCCIAAGVALALKEEGSTNKVWCFLGDGAEEEGHFYEAVMMVAGRDLPCTFIIDDNDRSVETPKLARTPTGFRVNWPPCVIRHNYQPTYPHAGNGTTKRIVFK